MLKRHDVGHEYGTGPIMSQAVEDSNLVHVAGMTADDKTAPIQEQTRQVLTKIDRYLAAAGTDKSRILSALILISDIGLRPRMNEVWQSWIDPKNPPARACVGVGFERTTNVEIIVTARKPGAEGRPASREHAMTIKRHEIGPIMSRAVEDGRTVYLAGMTADDKTAVIEEQTRQVLAKIDKYLALAGTDKSKILNALIFVSDIGLRPRMNEVWNAWVDPKNPPARACVQVGLEGKTNVEIMVVAAK